MNAVLHPLQEPFHCKLNLLPLMEELLIVTAALVASFLTLISGFGLGTLLLPVFALFFPLEIAVALTAVVHLLNNLFKTGLLWRTADLSVVLRFGIPGIIGAYLGALLLTHLEGLTPLYEGLRGPVSITKLVIGTLMLVFAFMELVPNSKSWSLPRKYLIPGGALSGFFGGLNGHQGALRSIFLLRCGLDKASFIATGVVIAVLVDIVRIPIYLRSMPDGLLHEQGLILILATAAAFLGAVIGKRFIPKITLRSVQLIVAIMLVLIAISLLVGLI